MTNNRRSYAAGAAAASLLGAAIAMASPAHAATYSLTVTCDNTSSASQTVTPGLLPGDTLTVTYNNSGTNPCTVVAIVPAAGQGLGGTLALTPTSGTTARVSGTYFYDLNNSGSVTLRVDSPIDVGSYVVNLGKATGTSPNYSWGATTGYLVLQGAQPEAPAAASGPADILQQMSVPSSGACTDVRDEGVRYGTNVSGGWSKSWSMWANNGRGGDVCTRTLSYRSSLGTWVVSS